ncbi:MAG: hypothetical protein Q8Q73_07790 [Stagnimonas sp.]|nr:hypothetical protein [Stagnimonas sp.]
MFHKTLIASGIALMLAVPLHAAAADGRDLEIDQLKQRVQALEALVQQLAAALPAPAVAAAPTPPPAPPPLASANSGNAFNPKISLILDGSYADYRRPAAEGIPGFLLGEETGPRAEGLALGETELAIEANIDHSFHGWATLAVGAEGDIGVEEAYINTLALPHGLALKFGRFFSDIGYQNHQHAHAWEFVDAPLVYTALLGTQLGDDGLQLRWLAPTDLFLELGAEALRGASFPAGGDERPGIKAYTGFVHLGGDVGTGGSWRLGLSHLRADADDRRSGEASETGFSGSSHLSILDAVYKWAPDGNAATTNFVAQAEYFYRREHGALVHDPEGSADFSNYRGSQQGFYVQGVYQFLPRWRVGARYDRLSASNRLDNPVAGTSLEQLAADGDDPRRYSLMADFSNSEFSRLRLQLNRDQSRPDGQSDDQVLVQYIFSLGSHPAHQF